MFFCSTLSEFKNFLLCERILINVNLSKRNAELILKILNDLEPLRGSSNKKKTLYSTRSCVNWVFFGTRGPKKA
jgi:predicted transcriptional regulator